jgi:hypothetical protein
LGLFIRHAVSVPEASALAIIQIRNYQELSKFACASTCGRNVEIRPRLFDTQSLESKRGVRIVSFARHSCAVLSRHHPYSRTNGTEVAMAGLEGGRKMETQAFCFAASRFVPVAIGFFGHSLRSKRGEEYVGHPPRDRSASARRLRLRVWLWWKGFPPGSPVNGNLPPTEALN